MAQAPDHSGFSFGRKPIAVHNREMEEHSGKLFPADPGRAAVAVFEYDSVRGCWMLLDKSEARPRPGFLNYSGKLEIEGERVLRRRDLTLAEFLLLPVAEPVGKTPP